MLTHDQVTWPRGFLPFYKKVRELTEPILTGTLLAVDPASGGTSLPGFSVWKAGELLTSGTIPLGKKRLPVYERLQLLYPGICELTDGPPDVFGIEMIRGQGFSSHFLHWAIGCSVAAARTPNVIETPMHVWKAVAKVTPGYIKGDAMDAEMIGQSLVLLAQRVREMEQAS
jgi:hypothetical protein